MITIPETIQAQQGLIRSAQLRDLARDRAELRRWTRRLRRMTHGVYADPHATHPLLAHRAVLLCLPDAVFRSRTALLLHGVRDIDPPERLQVFVDRPCDASDRPELEVRRADLTAVTRKDVHGLPVVSPARAGVDLARELTS